MRLPSESSNSTFFTFGQVGSNAIALIAVIVLNQITQVYSAGCVSCGSLFCSVVQVM